MCEIFPEVESCCGLVSVRVGMVLIGILSIITGAVSLGVIEQRSNINYNMVFQMYYNVSNYTKPDQAFADMGKLIPTTISAMSLIFMFSGLTLLFSTFTDQEGFAQIFVWLVFLNICVGMITVLAIAVECTFTENVCLLRGLDWLTSAVTLLSLVSYLILWFYFCCVANSYVLNAFT